MTTFGYYCLHPDQDPDQQRQALTAASCTVIHCDTWTTRPDGRPALEQILDQAVAGDVLTDHSRRDLPSDDVEAGADPQFVHLVHGTAQGGPGLVRRTVPAVVQRRFPSPARPGRAVGESIPNRVCATRR